ncbi:hypothetical protein [Amycolatopsis sp. 195334CR]|uniref:DUF6959 family protein n=1 Tax=Amycolatopsis sp. 195334CR TaxID=2814588 RepID=UPI001A8E6EBA|nr:hypothetical protein [Amycolatopsis sp. 195334CR]MBN6033359.1 hypothetical protein [Amycolatopsis sp. 195334CR]
MSKVDVNLISRQGNEALVKLSDRQYPGLLVQGDSLKILADTIAEAVDAAQLGNLEDVSYVTRELMEKIGSMMKNYEDMMSSNGLKLPYF